MPSFDCNAGNAEDNVRVTLLTTCTRRYTQSSYLDINVRGHTVLAALDTGRDYNSRLCKNMKILPTSIELLMASDTKIRVLVQTHVHFSVGGLQLYTDMLVSDQVLNFFTLPQNGCS